MKNATTNYENTFYFDGAALSGVLSVDGSYNLAYEPINVIGKGFTKSVMASVPSAQLSFSRYMTNDDPVFNLTGDGTQFLAKKVDAGVYYNNKYFAFEDGYLNSVGLDCSVGEVPTLNAAFNVYGDIGPNFNPSGQSYAGGVFVPQVKDISLTTRNSTTNRITNFSVNYSMPKQPIYGLSSSNAELPIEVHNVFPIEATASFNLEIDDYETKRAFSDLTSNGASSFSVSINGTILKDIELTTANGVVLVDADTSEALIAFTKNVSVNIFTFTSSDAVIESEQVNSTSDDVLSVNLSYKTYLN